ncbi:glycosyltransferase [bacterium]|nr:glycosyltransferase [bacterium]
MKKTKNIQISVVIAVYNRGGHLRYCLESLARQTYKDFEIVIADDGSGPEVKELIDGFRQYLTIKHVWQEDKNFRKCLILNKAVKISSGKQLFFFDGDVIVHPRYLEVSRKYVQEGQYMISRSAYLSETLTQKIFRKKMTVQQIFSAGFFLITTKDWIFGKTRFFEYGIFLPEALSKIASGLKKDKHIFGRCWAVQRSDYEKINGYNNDFVGAYYEDFEITARLNFSGAKPVLLIDRAVSWHLFHKRVSMEPQNLEIYARIKELRNPRCANGMDQINPEDIGELK